VSLDFDSFYRDEFAAVYRATYALTGNREDALDAVQESFEKAFARWRRLSQEPWAGGWVMTSALNAARRRLRRETKEKTLRSNDGVAVDPWPAPDRIDMLDTLRRLPFRQAQAMLLFYLNDFPVPKIADLMGISEGSVKAHASRRRVTSQTGRSANLKDARCGS